MPIGETVLLVVVASSCLFIAWAIGRDGGQGLIAGYRRGQLSAKEEAELVRDVRVMLFGVVGLLGLLVVDAWTEAVPRAGTVMMAGTVVLVGWVVWKWNRTGDG